METSQDYPVDNRGDHNRSREETQSGRNVKQSNSLPKADEEVTSAPCSTPTVSSTQPQKRMRKAAPIPNASLSKENISSASKEESLWRNRSLEQQVLFAGTIVAQALYDGPWPSPGTDTNSGISERTRHKVHMSMIGASLRKFCQDTVLKTMSDVIRNNESTVNRTEASLDQRPFLGTLLMIRELLAQNYLTIFGANGIRCPDKVDPGVATFASRVVATSVILFALQQQLTTTMSTNVFLDTANEYDESRESFTGLLSSYMDKKGDQSSELTNMQGDSFALHAGKHPLVANHMMARSTKRRKDNNEYGSDTLRIPEPNAVHITILRPTYCE